MNSSNDIYCATFEVEATKVALLEEDINWPMPFIDEPTLSVFETSDPSIWRVEIFTNKAVSKDQAALCHTVMCDHLQIELPALTFTRLAKTDWVAESQQLRKPIVAGSFVVYGDHINYVPTKDKIGINLDAGQAFGTGSHETTSGCLELLSTLKKIPQNVFDLGTGTGLLAIAAYKLWRCTVGASDIDPIAIDVSKDNLDKNHVPQVAPNANESGVWLTVSDGMEQHDIQKCAPYDLIVANILANPLIALSKSIESSLAENGQLVLSGINCHQEEKVVESYKKLGLNLETSLHRGDWSILLLGKPSKSGDSD